jgi:hypothetical protein
MTPRQRTMKAIADATDAWAKKYGIDDADWIGDGSSGPNRRSPTPDQAWELQRRVRELGGQDPATGRHLSSAATALATFEEVRDAVRRRWREDPAESARRVALVDDAYVEWRLTYGIDDRGWGTDVWAIPRAQLPHADQAWELVRAARVAAGQDPVRGTFVE